MFPIHTLSKDAYPPLLKEIPKPPETLYIRGSFPKTSHKFLSVVGARKHTPYAHEVIDTLLPPLKEHSFVIVSGLALGIDTLAHKKALEVGIPTVAIPGSGLDDSVLYPKTNRRLALDILEKGGCLLSEFDPHMKAQPWTFPQRNRIMAGISHAVLVIECEEKSGSRITARLGNEYNRDVLAVPGNISSPLSSGTNALLKEGAVPITKSEDILAVFGEHKNLKLPLHPLSEEEIYILSILTKPRTRKSLEEISQFSKDKITILISSLEIKGEIQERLGKIERT